ncbi:MULTISPECIES: TetR family transcriptional regulator [Falsihalocynthiibacter]|uniref:TetR family transcriptional regulator n=1 Tax=Falsihalocynthiibacter TaxID=2854182 RepID=UPI0030015649
MTLPPRKRNANATQEAILVAARRVFTDNGYDGAGLREIAGVAGVNVALINRYFGSKDGLFKAAIIEHLHLEEIFDGDMNTLGQRIADYFLAHPVKKEGYDPTLAILRSTSSEHSVRVISEALEATFNDVLASRFPDIDPKMRRAKTGLLVSVMLGYDMMRRVFKISALGEDTSTEVRSLLAQNIQSIVDAKI